MFGFGKQSKLKKLGNELKGAHLREVVEKYANPSLIERPSLAFSEEIALLYKKNITAEETTNVESLIKKIEKITSENDLEDGSHHIYLAYNSFQALQTYALDLTLATKLMGGNEEPVNYLFKTWIKAVPIYYVIPILFPAKCGGRIEDFSIDRDIRYAMIDELFERLKSTDQFASLVNSFAEDHPYFRQYPL